MTDPTPTEARRARFASRLSLRGWLLVAGLLGAAVALRVALPSVVREQLVEQGNAALDGKLEVGDVDLWLLRGGIGLADVSLRDEAAGASDPPLVALKKLYVEVGWLSLLRGVLRIEDVDVVGLHLNGARLEDGVIVLPRLREAEAGPSEARSGASWPVVIERMKLVGSHIGLRDDLPGEPILVEVGLPSIELAHLRLQPEEGAAPARGVIEARIRDGTVRIEPSIDARADGFALDILVDAQNVPLDRLHVHAGLKRWSDSKGRLEARMHILSEPGGSTTISGTLAIDDLEIRVPGEDEPAVSWRRLAVEAERIDLTAQEARIKRVSLDGAHLLVRPRTPELLPVMAGEPEQASASTPQKSAAAPENAEAATPWKWRVETLEVKDSRVKTFLEPPPLEIEIAQATATGLDSAPGSSAHLTLTLREGEGAVDLEGDMVLDPVSLSVQARLTRLGLARLVAAGSPQIALSSGTLGGELDVKYDADSLTVTGQIEVVDLAAKLPDGEDFAVEWQRLGVDIGEVRVPLASATADIPVEPLLVRLDDLRLVSPRLVLTRTADGVALPGARGEVASEPALDSPPAADDAKPSPPDETSAEPGPGDLAPASPPDVRVLLDTLTIESGAISFTDRTVTPTYDGRVRRIHLEGKQVDLLAARFDQLSLRLDAPGRAPLEVRGASSPEEIRLDIELKNLRLPQFNPYATPAMGYTVTSGAATLRSEIQWGAERYKAKNKLELDDFELGGTEGEALFLEQFGVPLSLALALLRDTSGQIGLSVPLKGDLATGASVDVAPVVAEALSRAILNAVTSPLKLIGSFSREGDRIEGLAPAPILFPLGRAELTEEAAEQLEELAIVLARLPALRLALRGTAGRDDSQALAEAAVLADLEDEGFLAGAWSDLTSGGARSAILDALHARAKGEAAELDPENHKKLEALLAAKRPSEDDLVRLAQARAEKARAELEKHAVSADRLDLVEPRVDPEQGAPEVAVTVAGS